MERFLYICLLRKFYVISFMFDSDLFHLFIKQTLIYSDLQMRNIKSDSSFEGNNRRSADNTKFQSLSQYSIIFQL